jgi:Arm DNA-binding domain
MAGPATWALEGSGASHFKEARKRARENRMLLADGIDPIEEKRKNFDSTRAEAA